jgi:hypothetical protein
MTRRRFIQDPETLELIEVTSDHQPDARAGDASLWGDRSYDGLRAPDGSDISSRSKHKAYMKATGLTTADDFKGSWAQSQQARENYRQKGGSISREDIARSIAKLKGY